MKDEFTPNDDMLASDRVTILDYGNYAFALRSTQTLLELKAVFNAKDANQIYVAAIITVVDGFTHMKDMGRCYKESF